MTQRDRILCDCGQQAIVTPMDSPWEFDIRCVCGFTAWQSWAHYKPPPRFQRTVAQLDLLETV